MRWNASICAGFMLLAGCVGHGGYSDLPEASAAPSAGVRDFGSDPYSDGRYAARPAPAQDRAPVPQGYAQAPRLDPYAAPGAGYAQPGQDAGAMRDPTEGMSGPRGSSEQDGSEQRYDEVGYAGVRGVSGGAENGGAAVAVARSVPAGTVLEVTALDSGKTILVLVTGAMEPGADHPVDLSAAAARQLGATSSPIPVRVRKVSPAPADMAALRSGQLAADRADTPPVLLTALRKHLPSMTPSAAPPAYSQPAYAQPAYSQPAYAPPRAATPPARAVAQPGAGSGYYVQVGAFSNAANAQSLARSLGGFVRPGGGLAKVQLGPFRSAGEAEAARARVSGQFPDARVFTQ